MNVEHFRTVLLGERKRLEDAIAYLHAENPGSIEDEVEEARADIHLAETASVTFDRELDYTLEENAEHVLAAIDEALARIDAGTYGVCVGCGKQIAEERLDAMPYARKCIDCKRLEERA